MGKSVLGKKRNATSNIQSKPSKAIKKAEQSQKIQNDLFNNLDEEMDQEEMENLVKQINGQEEDSESGEEEEQMEHELVEDDEEEYEPNEFDNINFDEDDEPREKAEDKHEEVEEDKMEQDQPNEKQSTFRDLYMAKVTQAFGSDLDTIRQEPNFNTTRLNILIDSLEAGIDIFSNTEQEIILADEQK